MKNILTTVAAIALATPVFANEAASNVRVFDHTKTVTVNVPVTTTECYDVEVPIYGRTQGNGASGGDVLGGMILGGLLGKGATGKDDGAAIGAILGGIVAADNKKSKQVVTGYRVERQCSDKVTNRYQSQEVYSHSTVRFTVGGYRYVLEFNRSDR